jgi:hypothetical protein
MNFFAKALPFLIASAAFGCNSYSDKSKADFENIPDSIAKRYVDSLAWVIDKSIPIQQRGFPTNQKDKSYFEERPYLDSSGRLKKVTVYEYRGDSFISWADYHYWRGRFIKMRNDVAGSGQMIGIAYYIFNDDKLIDSSVAFLKPIPADTLLKRANAFRLRFEKP